MPAADRNGGNFAILFKLLARVLIKTVPVKHRMVN